MFPNCISLGVELFQDKQEIKKGVSKLEAVFQKQNFSLLKVDAYKNKIEENT